MTPSTDSISDGDQVSITLPGRALISLSPVCAKLSANIISISCQRATDQLLKVVPVVDPVVYKEDKKLVFSVSYIRNADIEGS